MRLVITASDQVLARYGNALAALGEGQARTALSRALNHEGDKGRTKVKRALVKQTGIKYSAVNKAMATVRATPATLTYTLKARGGETNIAARAGEGQQRGCVAGRRCEHRGPRRSRDRAHAAAVMRLLGNKQSHRSGARRRVSLRSDCAGSCVTLRREKGI
jgi:hypothetical protein